MICSKCNSEIPDGSRFCSVCGAPCGEAADVKPAVAQVSSGKYHCAKCGLELEQGAKFCTSCGEPAANVGNVAPIANNGETFGNGDMAHVSLAKEPDAGDLVAAMNSAASASAPAPTPAAVPTPAPAPTPTSVPAPAPSANNAPGFVPSGNSGYAPSSVMGGYNGLSGAAAVVTAPPATKKKVSGGKIALIIVIVLVLLLGGATVFFFTNKAAALSLIMGKPKYAAMVEKQSLKEASEKLDTAVLSGQIKTFSSIMSTLGEEDLEDMFPSLGLSNRNDDVLYSKLMSREYNYGVDVKGMLKGYNEFMQNTYGAGRIYGNFTMDVSLGAKLRDEIGDDIDEVNKILDLLNGAEITYDAGLNEKQAGMEFGIKLGSKPINVKATIADDGSVYAMFPFASDKALKYKMIDTDDSGMTRDTVLLDLDEKEISRLLGELIDIYTNYIKESSVTMEKGGLVAAGIPVEGKQITVDIGGDKLAGLIRALFEHVADDAYFCGKIVDYVKSYDPSYTAADYKNDILDAAPKKGDIRDTDRLIVTTIVNNGGNILAKSYKIVTGSHTVGEVILAESGNTGAVEFKEDDKTTLTILSETTSLTDGKITLNVGTDDNESIGIIVDYSGVGKATFGKTELPVGTYNLKFDVSGVKDMDDDEKDILRNFTLSLSESVEGGTNKTSISIDIKNYISAKFNVDATLSNDMSKFDPPANAIDFSDPYGSIDDKTAAQLDEFGKELLTGLQDALKGTPLEDLLAASLLGSGGMSGPDLDFGGFGNDNFGTGSGNAGNLNTKYVDVSALEDAVWEAADEVGDWIIDYDVYIGDAFDNAYDYWEKLDDLDDRIWEVYDTCTAEQLAAFQKEFNALTANKEAIHSALKAASKNSGSSNMTATTATTATTTGNTQNVHHDEGYGHHSNGSHHDSNCPNGSHCTLGHNCPYYA